MVAEAELFVSFARRVDNNQAEIVRQLRAIPGVTVEVGHDDILVGFRGLTRWYEIKSDHATRKNGSVRRKQSSQERLERDWRGHYRVVTGLEEILRDMGLTK